jgi:hypothetical protein
MPAYYRIPARESSAQTDARWSHRVGSRRRLGASRRWGSQVAEPQSRRAAAASASISSIVSDRGSP